MSGVGDGGGIVRDNKLVYNVARAFLNDRDSQIFTDEVLRPFLENAAVNHPQASERRLAAITAMCAMDQKGWHEGARAIRESIEAGLL